MPRESSQANHVLLDQKTRFTTFSTAICPFLLKCQMVLERIHSDRTSRSCRQPKSLAPGATNAAKPQF
jgi:hypothetical protein